MNSDEINRTIDFILQSQSNAATRMDEMEKLQEATSRQVRELSESTLRFQEEMRGFREDIKGFIRVLVPLLENHSIRLDRLEGQT
jgi:hypothetical protein